MKNEAYYSGLGYVHIHGDYGRTTRFWYITREEYYANIQKGDKTRNKLQVSRDWTRDALCVVQN